MAYENTKFNYSGDMAIFIGGKPIAFSTDASLDTSRNMIDAGSKDAGKNEEYIAGKVGYTASATFRSAEGLVSGSTSQQYDTLYALYLAGAPVAFVFASMTGTAPTNSWTVNAAKKKFTGTVLIESMSSKISDGTIQSWDISFKGTGALVLS